MRGNERAEFEFYYQTGGNGEEHSTTTKANALRIIGYKCTMQSCVFVTMRASPNHDVMHGEQVNGSNENSDHDLDNSSDDTFTDDSSTSDNETTSDPSMEDDDIEAGLLLSLWKNRSASAVTKEPTLNQHSSLLESKRMLQRSGTSRERMRRLWSKQNVLQNENKRLRDSNRNARLRLKRVRNNSRRAIKTIEQNRQETSRLRAEVKQRDETIDQQNETIDELQQQIKSKSRQLTQARHYRKTVAAAKHEIMVERDVMIEETQQLRSLIAEWEQKYDQLQYEMVIADTNKQHARATLSLFANGKYDDRLRLAVLACMNANVGKNKIGKLVQRVVRSITGQRIEKLPAPSTIAGWGTELNVLSQLHCFERMTIDPTAIRVLAHDGTTKSEDKIMSGSVHIDRSTPTAQERESIALYLRKTVDGTAESAMRALTDAIEDINRVGSKAYPNRSMIGLSIFNGTISDHNTTEKKQNQLLSEQIQTDTKESARTNLACYCWNHKLENWANAIGNELESQNMRKIALECTVGIDQPLIALSWEVAPNGIVSTKLITTVVENTVVPRTKTVHTAWRVIDEAVKLFRCGGNDYGHAIGRQYRHWCELHKKRDTLKGLTRLRGVRPDALFKNAKPLLLTATNDIQSYWKWRVLQKVNPSDKVDNGLVMKVKANFENPRIIAELWLLAVLSDGLIRPLMYAINESDRSKDMWQMRQVMIRLRHSVKQWAVATNLPPLCFGWLTGNFGVEKQRGCYPHVADILCGAFECCDDKSRRCLAAVCRQTRWNIHKTQRVSVFGLSYVLDKLLTSIDHFTPEYQPGGALYQASAAVKQIARTCPPNNDHVERSFGLYSHYHSAAFNTRPIHNEARVLSMQNHTLDWLLRRPLGERVTVMEQARLCTTETKRVVRQRIERDRLLHKERCERLAKQNEQRQSNQSNRTNRTSEQRKGNPLLKSVHEFRVALEAIKLKTDRLQFLKTQLNYYKEVPYNEKQNTQFSIKGKALTADGLQSKLESLIKKHFGDTPRPPPTTPPQPPAHPPPNKKNKTENATSEVRAASFDTCLPPLGEPPPLALQFAQYLKPPAATSLPVPSPNTGAINSSSSGGSNISNSRGSEGGGSIKVVLPETTKADSNSYATSRSKKKRKTLLCCDQPMGSGDRVQCDTCNEWKHCECEGVDVDDAQEADEYQCISCRFASL